MKVLPDELILQCLAFLSPQNLAVTSLVSKQLRGLSNDESLWRFLCKRNFPCQPEEQPHKLHYQTCFNIKKGRYSVRPSYGPPYAMLFQGNQSIHRFPRKTTMMISPYEGSYRCLKLPPAADLNNLYLEWNGNRVAVACLVDGTPSVQIYSCPNLEICQTLPMRTIGFLWYGEQLVTASVSQGQVVIQIWGPDQAGKLQVMYSCVPQGAEDIVKQMKHREKLQNPADLDLYQSIAWDGKWLAFCNIKDSFDARGVYIWKVTAEKLMPEVTLEELRDSYFLRWKDHLLFIRNGSDKILIWDRDQKKYLQEIDCGVLIPEDRMSGDSYTTDIHIRGNQLFITYGSSVSLWETDKNGTYIMVYKSFQYIERCGILNFHRDGLYVGAGQEGSRGDNLLRFSFWASHREMLESLSKELKFLTENEHQDGEYVRQAYHVIYDRLLRMPESKTKPIFQELDQIKVSYACKHTYENYSQLRLNPLQLAQPIDNYLTKTKN